MDARHRVVLYGDSVVLSGVGKSLERYPRLEVLSLDASPSTIPEQLDALCPNVVILELGTVKTDLAFALLHDHPNLLLIGLDQKGDRLVVLSGCQASLRTEDDLLEAIGHPPAKRRTKASPTAGIPAVSSPTKEEQ